eukprot:9681116-Alexandrium_andersonii.AAC.1
MSASLVGSEMCIRDRLMTGRPETRLISVSPGYPWFVLLPPSQLSCTTPVSYTHLTLPTICSV